MRLAIKEKKKLSFIFKGMVQMRPRKVFSIFLSIKKNSYYLVTTCYYRYNVTCVPTSITHKLNIKGKEISH